MRDWNDDTPLSLREVARELGMDPKRGVRKLRRHIRRREEALGRRLLVPLGGGEGKGARYGLSISALLEACPEVAEGHERRFERLEKRVGHVEQKLLDLEEVVNETRALIGHLIASRTAAGRR